MTGAVPIASPNHICQLVSKRGVSHNRNNKAIAPNNKPKNPLVKQINPKPTPTPKQ